MHWVCPSPLQSNLEGSLCSLWRLPLKSCQGSMGCRRCRRHHPRVETCLWWGEHWNVVWRLAGIARQSKEEVQACCVAVGNYLHSDPPAGHGWQGVPVAGEKCPAGHSWQLDWSGVGWVPAAHSVQDV